MNVSIYISWFYYTYQINPSNIDHNEFDLVGHRHRQIQKNGHLLEIKMIIYKVCWL